MSKPSLLLLSYFVPSSTGGGARMRAWAWLQALRRLYDVHLVLLGEAPEAALEPYVSTLTYIEPEWECVRDAPEPSLGSLRFLSAVLRHPPQGTWRLSRDELRRLAAALPMQRFDAVFAVRLSMATLGAQLMDARLIGGEALGFDLDDRESLVVRRSRAVIGRSRGRALAVEAVLRYWRLRSVEKRMFERWGRVFICSSQDQADLAREYPRCAFKAVPNAVQDPGLLPFASHPGPARLLFVGSLSYAPNQDGLIWFINEVWPLLSKRFVAGEIELSIVGRRPSRSVRELAGLPGVSLHSDVDSVVPYYADADAVIVPLRFGGGTRIKILESMALGRPLVSTTLGAEGLEVRDGGDILIADRPDDFADRCEQLLRDAGMHGRLREAGRQTYEARYTIEAFERSAVEFLGRSG